MLTPMLGSASAEPTIPPGRTEPQSAA